MKRYYQTQIKELFSVSKIATVHYYELSKNFSSNKEKHNFWEVVYVDRGETYVKTDLGERLVKAGQAVFYYPNESHASGRISGVAANIGIVSFVCKSPAMEYFKGQVISLTSEEKNLFSGIIDIGIGAFEDVGDDEAFKGLKLKDDASPAALQLIKVQLEHLLIKLYIRENNPLETSKQIAKNKDNQDKEIILNIREYLENNLTKNLTIEQIGKYFGISQSYVKMLFKEGTGSGIIDYYINLKIEKAKELIRDSTYNFTQIADELGFSSVHYFSRIFKQKTSMTPSEYSRSIISQVNH